MKILWVKSGGLVPLSHGGRIRSFHLAKSLAQRNELSLFTFYEPTADDPHHELRGLFSKVICVPLSIPEKKSGAEYVAYARNLFSSRPYSVTKYCQPHVAAALREHLQRESYDVLICDFLLTAGVVPWDMPGPRVLFTHNVEAQIWERHFRVARNPVWKAVCYREFKMMERMEHHYLKRADHVLAVSDADASNFARVITPSKISVIPTGVDVDFFQPEPGKEEPRSLVFTGSMDWLANEEGIFHFVQNILPVVRREIPEVTLWVVGRNPTQRLRRLAESDPSIKVTGSVPDIRPYIAKGTLYIVPLLVGGGTRIKIYEAMAMGKPVLSTSIGAEGLPVNPERDIILADTNEDFARRAIALLRDAQSQTALGESARLLVETNYSWGVAGKKLNEVLEDVARRHSAQKQNRVSAAAAETTTIQGH